VRIGSLFSGYGGLDNAVVNVTGAEVALRILLEGVTLPAGGGQVNLPTPTVSDTYTDNLKSTQQKEGSMHSVTLPQAVRWVSNEHSSK